MNYRTLLIFSVVGLLLVASLEAAKPAKGGKGKSVEAKPAKVEKVKAEKAVAVPAMVSAYQRFFYRL